MRLIVVSFIAAMLIAGCARWGGYVHNSEKLPLKIIFPEKWDVFDRSDDRRDFLVASYPGSPDTKIEVTTTPTAPDIHPNEIYPTFQAGGGDQDDLLEFEVTDRGSVSCSNAEGRYIKVQWLGEKSRMRGYRALFLGNRYLLEIRISITADDYITHELELAKMMKYIEI